MITGEKRYSGLEMARKCSTPSGEDRTASRLCYRRGAGFQKGGTARGR